MRSSRTSGETDLDGLRVGGHDNELADTTVQGLGSLVGALLELHGRSLKFYFAGGRTYLLVVRRLLDEVEDLVGEIRIREGERLGVGSSWRKSQPASTARED